MSVQPDELSAIMWTWCIKGLGGCINTILRMISEGPRIPSGHVADLHAQSERLREAVRQCRVTHQS